MRDCVAEESARLIREFALARGHQVTPHQLHRWQQSGLLRKPRQSGLGRARGTEVLYAAGTSAQVVRLCELLKENRSLVVGFWRLWWEGCQVDAERVRTLLHDKLDQLENFSSALEANGEKDPGDPDDTLDWLGRLARGPLTDSAIKRLRARVGIDDFATFLLVVSEIASGKFGGWGDPDDRKLLASALDFSFSPENQQDLIAISRVLDLRNLRQVLKETSLKELENARDELREIFELLDKLIDITANFIGKRAADPLGPTLSNLDFRRFLLIAWLAARQFPSIKAARQQLIGMARGVQAVVRIANPSP